MSYLQKFFLVTLAIFVLSSVHVSKSPDPVIMFAPPAMIHSEDTFSFNPAVDILASLTEWDLFFDRVSEQTNVTIILNGPGGWLVVLNEVRDRIKELSPRVKMTVVVTRVAASADAMAICEFPKAIISPQAVLIYHMVAGPDGVEIHDEEFETCKQKGFITEEEIKKMDQGFEVWVRYDADGNRTVEFKPDERLPQNQPQPQQPTPTPST